MKLRIRWSVSALLCLLVLAPATAQEKRLRTFVDALEQPVLSDPQLSPDGKQIAFVINRADWKANRHTGHIFRINSDGTNQVQLTFGERGESSPRWSPDGKSIAFTARRDPDSANQIYVLHADGGEARKITSHATATGNITWAPDGKSIYFTATDAKSAEERERDRVQDDVFAFEENNFKQRHLWTTDLEGKTKRVTDGDWSVGNYELSADGTRIAMHRTPTPLLGSGERGEVWVMDASGQNARQLTTNGVSEANASLSPDGALVLFTADSSAQFEHYYNDKLFLVPAAGGAARVLLPADVSYEVESAAWSNDSKTHLLHRQHGRAQRDHESRRGDAAGDAAHEGRAQPARLVVLGRPPACTSSCATPAPRPSEVYVMPAAGGEPTRVSAVFDDDLAKFKNARIERITWKGQDGVTVEGLLYYPVDYKPGQKYPLIVATHGGPAASDRVWLRHRDSGLRGQGLRGAAPELSRQHGLRRRVPARHGQGLLQAGAPGRDGRHRRRDRDGRGRSRQARSRWGGAPAAT